MKGSKFLKVTGILMIIGSAMVILLGVIVAGFGALVAGIGAASGLTGNYFLALLATLVGGICHLVAGIMGVKHCKNPQKAKQLIIWGVLVVLFGIHSQQKIFPKHRHLQTPLFRTFLSLFSNKV